MKIAILGTGMVGDALATNTRGTEMFLALWVRLWGVIGHPHFNIHVVR